MDLKDKILDEAGKLQDELVGKRHYLHQHPEVGFELENTKKFVIDELTSMGYTPKEVGKCGVVAIAGGKKPGKCILLRADMDALNMTEEADVDFKSLTPGKMHGCGHDMHTTMLLGAARILKDHEDEIEGCVKLMFQPAEEIFKGSLDMISAGVLENPKVDAAVMIHVIAGLPMPTGMFMVPNAGGVTMNTCEQYKITVVGKGGHGSTPSKAIDPITAAAHVHLSLQEVNARELSQDEYGVFTTCSFQGGNTSNVIPDSVEMRGTIRTADLDRSVNKKIKKRIEEISTSVAQAFRCKAKVEFSDFCPCMKINDEVTKKVYSYMSNLFGEAIVPMEAKAGGGSEDFAFISEEVPATSIFISAGGQSEGYEFGQHHPKVRFNDSCLSLGSAAYSYIALQYLSDNQ